MTTVTNSNDKIYTSAIITIKHDGSELITDRFELNKLSRQLMDNERMFINVGGVIVPTENISHIKINIVEEGAAGVGRMKDEENVQMDKHEWNEGSGLTKLHEKEIVLNKEDTENFLKAIDTIRLKENKMNIYKGQFESEINYATLKYNVDPFLIASIIQVESGFNPIAESVLGSKGLMQLMPGTCKEVGISNPFDPQQNIEGGTSYIADRLLEFEGDVKKALAAYNCGSGMVRKYDGIPPFKETERYVSEVMKCYEDLLAGEENDDGDHFIKFLFNMSTTTKLDLDKYKWNELQDNVQTSNLASSKWDNRFSTLKQIKDLEVQKLQLNDKIDILRSSLL